MEKLDQNTDFWKIFILNNIELASPIVPHHTLSFMRTCSESIPFKFTEQEFKEIFICIVKDFPVLENFFNKRIRGGESPVAEGEYISLRGLLKWLIYELHIWDEKDDKTARKLALILIISNRLSKNLWELIPESLINNPRVCIFLASRFDRFRCTIDIPQEQQVPLWEIEAVTKYDVAIKNRDWLHLANNWHIWGGSHKLGQANTFQHQIFLFLLNYSNELLLSAATEYEDFISLMLICREHSFSLGQRFQLALNTTNNLFRFALLFSLELNNSKYDGLTELEADCFALILKKCGNNSCILKQWFTIFNRYLIRYPIFSEGFGVYLAKYASEIEMDLFVESQRIQAIRIEKDAYGVGDTRLILNKTFQKFSELAELELRKILWNKCYQKWKEWNFGSGGDYYFLNEIHLTNIDYALIGYFVECIDQSDREVTVQAILLDIDNIFTNNWYASVSEMMNNYYNLLSKLQPVCQADIIVNEVLKSWVTEAQKIYYSDILQRDERYQIAFNHKGNHPIFKRTYE